MLLSGALCLFPSQNHVYSVRCAPRKRRWDCLFLCILCVCFYVSYVFFIALGYGSSRLSHVNLVTCVAFKSVYPTWIAVSLYVCYLLLYCVSCFKGDVQLSLFEEVCYASYEWAVICKGYPSFTSFSRLLAWILLFLFSSYYFLS